MRAYIIKFKGKTIWQNMLIEHKLTFNDGYEIYAGTLFFVGGMVSWGLDTTNLSTE